MVARRRGEAKQTPTGLALSELPSGDAPCLKPPSSPAPSSPLRPMPQSSSLPPYLPLSPVPPRAPPLPTPQATVTTISFGRTARRSISGTLFQAAARAASGARPREHARTRSHPHHLILQLDERGGGSLSPRTRSSVLAAAETSQTAVAAVLSMTLRRRGAMHLQQPSVSQRHTKPPTVAQDDASRAPACERECHRRGRGRDWYYARMVHS